MRFSKAKDLLELAIAMRVSHRGLSLADIRERYGCSLRTAHRMRDAVWDLFPLEECWCDGEGVKRWRVTASNVDLFVGGQNDAPRSNETSTA